MPSLTHHFCPTQVPFLPRDCCATQTLQMMQGIGILPTYATACRGGWLGGLSRNVRRDNGAFRLRCELRERHFKGANTESTRHAHMGMRFFDLAPFQINSILTRSFFGSSSQLRFKTSIAKAVSTLKVDNSAFRFTEWHHACDFGFIWRARIVANIMPRTFVTRCMPCSKADRRISNHAAYCDKRVGRLEPEIGRAAV